MRQNLMRAIILLPGTVLVFVPVFLLLISGKLGFSYHIATPSQALFWLSLLAGAMGFVLCFWTVTLFLAVGEGTPAPWAPPKKLVIRGPYRHVRNPMITGVLLLLVAEVLFFQSWLLVIWMILFFIANAIYFPKVEEKGLEKRHGDAYRTYKAQVPRWISRLKGWSEPANRSS